MQKKAQELGLTSRIYSDKFESNADDAGKILISETADKEILLVGGETTVRVLDKNGKGGRNQELILTALSYVGKNTTIVSIDSDGWDNTEFAGAIGDTLTVQKTKNLGINPKDFLEHNNSFSFFEKTKDGIITGRLPSNVSDLMVVIKS
ncbi:MAG: MOFRL family protein, partial [Candidatus Levybacteria bacterium]|nr:MOFRL family protein [Candidatus Levybacteria bacterium]